MTNRANGYDRALTVVLICGIIVLTGSVVRRETRQTAAPDKPALEPPRFLQNWSDLAATGTRIGPQGSRITIIEFADLQCPACKGYQAILEGVQRKYGNDVALVFVHYPLGYHNMAATAARALECAGKQGAFAAFLHAVYAKQESLAVRPLSLYAREAGIADLGRFEACSSDSATVPAINAGLAEGKKIPVRFTPTIIVNGWLYPYPPQRLVLDAKIDSLLTESAKAFR